MKILARQLTLDLYNCNSKRLENHDDIKEILQNMIGEEPKIILLSVRLLNRCT